MGSDKAPKAIWRTHTYRKSGRDSRPCPGCWAAAETSSFFGFLDVSRHVLPFRTRSALWCQRRVLCQLAGKRLLEHREVLSLLHLDLARDGSRLKLRRRFVQQILVIIESRPPALTTSLSSSLPFGAVDLSAAAPSSELGRVLGNIGFKMPADAAHEFSRCPRSPPRFPRRQLPTQPRPRGRRQPADRT